MSSLHMVLMIFILITSEVMLNDVIDVILVDAIYACIDVVMYVIIVLVIDVILSD